MSTGLLFLSTPSVRRATEFDGYDFQQFSISIHALREEGDRGPECPASRGQLISIHALREEGDLSSPVTFSSVHISIHALREEGDGRNSDIPAEAHFISIHALREEGDR